MLLCAENVAVQPNSVEAENAEHHRYSPPARRTGGRSSQRDRPGRWLGITGGGSDLNRHGRAERGQPGQRRRRRRAQLRQHRPPDLRGGWARQALPPNTRLSFREISCGVDGGGTTICTNSRDQTGFVLSPAGSTHRRLAS